MSGKDGLIGRGNLLSLVAIVISLSALGVSVFEVTSLKDQQKASVWPYLEVAQSYSGTGFEVTISNKGIGPALLGDVGFVHNGQRLTSSDDLDALILETVGPERAFSYDTYRARDASNDVLAPGETATLFGVPWTADTRAFLEGVGGGISAEGCYCSVYKECWSVKMGELPERTKVCRG
ncbi:MAG: hypothetical protein AAGL99_12105 [Pseudomonadota bacterium]